MAKIAVGIEQLLSACSEPSSANAQEMLKIFSKTSEALAALPADRPNTCLLYQYEEQLKGYKRELSDIRRELLSYDVDCGRRGRIVHSAVFNGGNTVQLKVCHLLKGSTREQPVVSSDTSGKGVKLPKIDVPTFDGNILNWQSFWEQFSVSIHDCDSLLNSIGEVGIHVPPALPQGWSSKACY